MADESKLTVTGASCGASHTAAVLGNRIVVTWGKGEDGQLGLGNAEDQHHPVIVSDLKDKQIDFVACGAEYTIAVSHGLKEIWSWGWGDFGRLGHGDPGDLFLPKPIKSLSGIPLKTVACGDAHTLVVTAAGDLYSFGRNQNGQLGTGSRIDALIPKKVEPLSRIESVSCGAEHSLACNLDGEVFSWGWGKYGNLGLGDFTDRDVPEKVEGALVGMHIKEVACGWRHSCCVDGEGRLFTFGWSKYGQLGHGNNEDKPLPARVIFPAMEGGAEVQILHVAGGWRHTMVCDTTGACWSWGWNQHGQLGDGTRKDACFPVRVKGMGPVAGVNCGWRHSAAVTKGGDIWTWGRGVSGQLGHQELGAPTPAEGMDSSVPAIVPSLQGGRCTLKDLEAAFLKAEEHVPAVERYALVPNAGVDAVPEVPAPRAGDAEVPKRQKVAHPA